MSKFMVWPRGGLVCKRIGDARVNVNLNAAIVAGVMGLACTAALAAGVAPDPGAVQRLEKDQLERYRQTQLLKQVPIKPELTVPVPPKAEPASLMRNISVKQFNVNKSGILSDDAVHAALAAFENRTLSLADLFEAVDAINSLYAAMHMPTARAVLPPQDVRDGIVHIQLVEARVGEMQIGSLISLAPAFIRDRLSLQQGDLFSVPRLEEDLVRFNRLHEAQISANLQAGQTVGTTDVQLSVAEPSRFHFSVFADNAGRETVGAERLGVTVNVLGVAGRDDNLVLSAVNSSGTGSYSVNYSLPITNNDLRFDLAYNNGNMKVISGAFAPLDIGGNSTEWSMGLVQPVVVDSQRLWSVYGRASKKHSVSSFGGFSQTPLELFALTAGFSGQQLNEASAWTLDVSATEGLRAVEGQVDFSVLRINAGWRGRFGDRSQLVLRGALQYSTTDNLPSGEAFQLGGSASVRGYPEGMLSGRQGFLSSIEWQYSLNRSTSDQAPDSRSPQWTSLVFLDAGGAFPYRVAPLEGRTHDDFLTGAGIGVSMEWRRSVSGRLTVAWPLRDNAALSGQNEPRFMASVTYSWP